MTAFERCVQKIDESEEEFMTHFLQLFRAANPKAKTEVINHGVKCKFLQGISDTLRRNIFIFCTNPHDEKVSHQDLLKASRDASVHLALESTAETVLPRSSDAVLTAANPLDDTLDAILTLSTKFEQQSQLAVRKIEEQQHQIKSMQSTNNFRLGPINNVINNKVPPLFIPCRETTPRGRGSHAKPPTEFWRAISASKCTGKWTNNETLWYQ